MNLGLAGKRVLVTGGGRGIGRACARVLAQEAARVFVCSRTASDIDDVVEGMGGTASGHAGVALDLASADGPRRLAAEAVSQLGAVDIVIHNVGGTLGVRTALAALSEWRDVWRINLELTIELNAMLVPPMIERGWGRVVSIGSLAGHEHQGAVAYAVSKAALAAYTRALGRELAATGVVVAAVAPGTVLTDGGVWDRRKNEEPAAVARYVAERLPAGRFQEPDAVAQTVAFLCSVHAGDFSGSVVQIDGGQGRAFRMAC